MIVIAWEICANYRLTTFLKMHKNKNVTSKRDLAMTT